MLLVVFKFVANITQAQNFKTEFDSQGMYTPPIADLLQHHEVSDHIAPGSRFIGHCIIHIVLVLPRQELAEYEQHLVRETAIWERQIHFVV